MRIRHLSLCRITTLSILLGLLGFLFGSNPCWAQVSQCFDGTFNLANYSQTIFNTDPTDVKITVSQSANGNPGTALEVKETWSAPNITFRTAIALINRSCTVNAFSPGAPFLTAIDFSVDSSVSGLGVNLGGPHNARPLLNQSGLFYVATVVGPTLGQGFQTIFGAGLSADSFSLIDLTTGTINPAIHPDFLNGLVSFGTLILFDHINAMPVGGEFDVLEDNLTYLVFSFGTPSFFQRPAAQELAKLMISISGLGLDFGTATSLNSKVIAAFGVLSGGPGPSACSDLAGLVSEAQAQSGKHLTTAQADDLLNATFQLQTELACTFF